MPANDTMPIDQALALADHACPTPVDAQRALRALRHRIEQLEHPSGRGSASDVVADILRDVCESDPSDPDAATTIKIDVNDLSHILDRHITEPAAGASVERGSRAALALTAVEGITTADLATLPARALAAARIVCTFLAYSRSLHGFNDDTDVSGSTAVDLLGSLWSNIQYAAGEVPPAGAAAHAPGHGNEGVAPRSMAGAPRDGRLLRLLVRFDENATDDAAEAWTIGSNAYEATGEDEWKVAGWCWDHDHFTEGKGTPIGWLPLLSQPVFTSWTAQADPSSGDIEEALALLNEYAAEFTEEPEFPDSLQGRVDAYLERMEKERAGEALVGNAAETEKDPRA